ncbi:acyltransferase domain-containing protein [Gryllotalpicola reticulitermitis]|uniref:Acyltransferase domain-containing protein n=1 Tax=Gryllotalpicola reticulitermitis TaxID=1184153 RepID=A0ABV8Q918_9MICO
MADQATSSADQMGWTIADFSATLNRRPALPYRIGLRPRSLKELAQQLGEVGENVRPPYHRPDAPLIAFAYTGQGSHIPGMGRALMRASGEFSAWVSEALSAVGSIADRLSEALLSEAAQAEDIAITAPAIFVFQVGLQLALREVGIVPDIVCGHSLGEFAASVAAGVFSPGEALNLVVERSRLMAEETPPGAMVALLAPVARARELALNHDLAIAAINSATEIVLSGSANSVRAIVDLARRESLPAHVLPVGRAFHSPAMSSITERFRRHVEGFQSQPAKVRFIRALPHGRVTDDPKIEAKYWAEQLCAPVQFADVIGSVTSSGNVAVVEIGAQSVLTKFAAGAGAGFAVAAQTPRRAANVDEMAVSLWERGYLDALKIRGDGRRLHLVLQPDGAEETGESSSAVRRDRAVADNLPPLERALANAWYDTVGVAPEEGVGYLTAGGDSLRALRFSELVAAHAGVDVPLEALLRDDAYRDILESIKAATALRDRETVQSSGPSASIRDYPPTPIQSRMLTAAEAGAVENVTAHVVFAEGIDVAALREALDDVQATTAILRSQFRFATDGWRATVAPGPLATLKDLSDSSLANVLAAAAVPLTSDSPAPLSAWLFEPAEGASHLVVAMHHAVSDAESMALFLRRLDAAYLARRTGQEPALDIDDGFIRVALDSAAVAPRVDSERRMLERLATQREQSFAFDRGGRAAGAPATRSFKLDHDQTTALRSSAAALAATPAAWILTAIALTLRIFDPADGETLSIAVPVDVRRRYMAGNCCGPLINLIPLSWPSAESQTFRVALDRARSELLEALNADSAAEGRADVDPNTDPFALFTTVPNLADVGYTSFTAVPVESTHAKYPMSWWFEDGDSATVGVEFDAGRIDSQVVDSMLEVVKIVATESQSNTNATGVALWRSHGPKALLADGGPAAEYQSISETIRRRLSEDRARVVLREGETKVTAGDLLDSAERISRGMQSRGAATGSLVVLRLGPTIELVQCILAAIFAQVAYLPIEESPVASVRDALTDFGVSLTIGPGDAHQLETDGTGADDRLDEMDGKDQLAYVILTSGSTGRRKGVAVTRGSLWNYLQWARSTYLAENAEFSLVSSPAVDLSVTSLLLPLVSSGTVWLPGRLEATTIVRASRAAEDDGYLKATPTHLELLLGATSGPLPWKVYIVGGEQLSGALLSDLLRRRPDAVVVNEFGPTEATVGCVVYKAEHADTRLKAVPIGRPIPGCSVAVVAADGREIPFGAIGELRISGSVLAHSYYRDDEKTSHDFVEVGGVRSYMTGDLARWEQDGLVYVSRTSTATRVKIRGQRVELGAIEHELRRLRGISAAKVFVDENSAGEPTSLVAFIVGNRRPDVRAALESCLRPAEIPDIIQWVERIPQSSSGKAVHPATLPGVGNVADSRARGGSTVARAVHDAFVTALGHGVVDGLSLSEQGAHSMVRLKAYAAAHEEFPFLRLQDFFERDSVAELAGGLRRMDGSYREPVSLVARNHLPGRASHHSQGARAADVVVTGANGLVGSALVREALAQGKSVLALARGTDAQTANDRVFESLEQMGGLPSSSHLTVIDSATSPVPDAVDLERSGSIIHAAGDIRHFGKTDAFVESNVRLTEIWALEATHARRPLIYLSSAGIEDAALSPSTLAASPYLRSKLAAERLLSVQAGLDYTIVRLGSVVGRSDNGRLVQDPRRTRVYRVLQAIIASGVAPCDLSWALDISPADLVARAILSVTSTSASEDRQLTISSAEPLSFAALAPMLRELGYLVEDGTRHGMIERLQLLRGAPAAKEALATVAAWIPSGAASTLRTFDQSPEQHIIPLPPISSSTLRTLLQRAAEHGLPIPPPAPQTAEWLN